MTGSRRRGGSGQEDGVRYEPVAGVRVAVLLPAAVLRWTYSPVTLAAQHALELIQAGAEVQFIVPQDATGADLSQYDSALRSVRLVPVLRQSPRMSAQQWRAHGLAEFESLARDNTARLNKALTDCHLCVTHDVMTAHDALPLNDAVRRVSRRLPGLRWAHWSHSLSGPRPLSPQYPEVLRWTAMPGARYVGLSPDHVRRLALALGLAPSSIAVVPNTVSPGHFLGLEKETLLLAERCALLNAEVLSVFPSRADPAKGWTAAVLIMAALKTAGKAVRLLFAPAEARSPTARQHISHVRQVADRVGLRPPEVTFTHDHIPAFATGTPRAVIRDLLLLSNLFLFPSQAEACPLAVIEAGLAKCLVVTSYECAACEELFGPGALSFNFGAYDQPSDLARFSSFWQLVARRIIEELERCRPLRLSRIVLANHVPRAGGSLVVSLVASLVKARPAGPRPSRGRSSGPTAKTNWLRS